MGNAQSGGTVRPSDPGASGEGPRNGAKRGLTQSAINQGQETAGKPKDLSRNDPPSSERAYPEPDRPFPFLSLPPELRTVIYDHCLIIPGEIVPYPGIAEEEDEVEFEKPTIALLEVSRLIRAEARPSLYSKNIWRLSPARDARIPLDQDWNPLPDVFKNNIPFFRHVSIRFGYRDLTRFYRKAVMSTTLAELYECRKESGNPDVPTRVELEQIKKDYHEDLFVVICAQKLVWLEEIKSHQNLHTVDVDFKEVVHPYTYEREITLARVASIVSSKWKLSGKCITRDSSRDPRSMPYTGKQNLRLSGLTVAEQDWLFL